MPTLRRPADAQQFTMLTAAFIAAAAACAGFDRGWAYGHNSDYHPTGGEYGPSVDLQVSLGWWNATTVVHTTGLPFEFTVTSAANKSLGVFAVILLGLSGLFALTLLVSSLVDGCYPEVFHVGSAVESTITAVIACLLFSVSVATYLALAIQTNSALKSQFGQGLVCFPDWALLFALLASGAWAFIAHAAMTASRSQPEGYLPM